ncbi:MAG: MMPL family transporter [Bacteroidales bacterium]|nr:MMPL family transporter [Bacteroidales bacterium]
MVRFRGLLLGLTTALAIVCILCIPRLNIIMDLPYFLPDDSPMKIGLGVIEKEFPSIDAQMNNIYVMFPGHPDQDSLRNDLFRLTEGLSPSEIKTNDNYTLFQFRPPRSMDVLDCKTRIEDHYGDSIIVELDIEKNIPDNIIPMIVLGFVLAFVILFIMCSSFMEVFLFMITTGIAVAINMGSNILLDGVAFLTNTMVGVLQMILSMDYSIILMNRFRQERMRRKNNAEAMVRAIHGGSRAILSSALTTIVSLLMLCFMHLKIGTDLGFVLAKGVFFSLMCNFTVLPALILGFDKAITATAKKTPSLPANALARFEMKFRLPLAFAFVAVFVVSFLLQRRTEVSFSALWSTPITNEFPSDNPVMLVYDNSEQNVIPGLLDTLEHDARVQTCLSYPSLMVKGYTAKEMAERFGQLSPLVTEDLLNIVYYAHSHPKRTEKLSVADMEDIGRELTARGLMPSSIDMDALIKSLTPPAKPAAKTPAKQTIVPAETAITPEPEVQPVLQDTAVVIPVHEDTVATAEAVTEAPARKSDNPITYELATTQLTAKQMAKMLGIDRSTIQLAYRMAGRTRKPATMSPLELSTFVVEKVLTDKRYSSYVDKQQAALIREAHRQLDSAFIAGPAILAQEDIPIDMPDSTVLATPADTVLVAAQPAPVKPEPVVVVPVSIPEEEEDEYVPPTPLERLAEMAFSGRKYSSERMQSALSAAGIPVSKDEMDLLYIYAGSRKDYNPETRMTVAGLLDFLKQTLEENAALAEIAGIDAAKMLAEARTELIEGVAMLHSDEHSVALIVTNYEFESPETFTFVERCKVLSDRALHKQHYVIGESVMYKEFKDEFPRELLLLTVLTVAAIFIIVLLTFKSFLIPILLIITVLSGVYVNVYVFGVVSDTMYFLAYLITQSILMGATIDYSILFVSYYRKSRLHHGVADSLAEAYNGSCHSILTSGLILTVAPYAMSYMISDAMVISILRSIAVGAMVAILIILFILPGMIAIADSIVAPRRAIKKLLKK